MISTRGSLASARRTSISRVLDQHPHAAAVLGAALDGSPAHAYLLHGPAGSGKRDAARDFAASLLAREAADPESARIRVQHGTHPDLTWVAPSGAHEMLRRDVDEAVVSAASRTPFEATHRVFVLERADTMNDEAANSLLKTLEEPPPYVVLLLLTDRPTPGAADDHLALPAGALRPAARGRARAAPAVTRRRSRRGRRVRAAVARRRRAGARAGARRGPGAARPRRGVRARAAGRPRPRRAGVAAAARLRPRGRRRGQGAGRGRARRGARVPAQEGAQAARDRVHRARPAGRAAGHDRRARPRAPARRPLVSRRSPASSPAPTSSSTTATASTPCARTPTGASTARCWRRSSSSTTPARGSR